MSQILNEVKNGHHVAHVFPDAAGISSAVGKAVAEWSAEAIADHGYFTIAFSGGSLPKLVANGLRAQENVDYSKWHVFFCDERLVSHADDDSNFKGCCDLFLNDVAVPKDQVYPIDEAHLGNVSAAAVAYEETVRKVFSSLGSTAAIPSFDVLLLGMGPDGHTCSLFPGHPLVKEDKLLIAPISDSPKPPPQRITMTFPLVNAAKHNAFVAAGSSKFEALEVILLNTGSKPADPLPAGLVKSATGSTEWFVDEPAIRSSM